MASNSEGQLIDQSDISASSEVSEVVILRSVERKSVKMVWSKNKLFPICNCGFGIWLNFDAVLRDSRDTLCGFAVFVAPLRPPRSTVFMSQLLCGNEVKQGHKVQTNKL